MLLSGFGFPHIFRFDDVSVNTNLNYLESLIELLPKDAAVVLAVSPIVFSNIGQRVHPPRLTAMSSLKPYYKGQRCGIPSIAHIRGGHLVFRAGHGIVHVDHRLLDYQAQEISILTSCALADGSIFVPPYNKWNADTEVICKENGIDLVKFEDGWEHVLHNAYRKEQVRYYLHPYDISSIGLKEWLR